MRSSVSYILSSTTSEPNMSHPDYEQFPHDHSALLVLVRQIGSQLKPKTFHKFFERICKNTNVKITDSTGLVRNIFVRYVKEHPVENNDWGDFQTHRRLLGLITLGKYDSQQELNELCRVHESLKVKYTSTLYDSRCILFGPPKDVSSPISTNSSSSDDNSKSYSDTEGKDDYVEKFTTPSNFKTRALFYNDSSPCANLEDQVIELIYSLFWILESKRLERSREKLERVSLLLAPFEKRDFVGLDMESKNNKKRCAGRMTKHLGDLCLQSGLLNDSLVYYATAAETLRAVNDWLWLGSAFEGQCAASSIILYPNMQRGSSFHRNSSLQEGSPKKISTSPTVNVSDISSLKKTVAQLLLPEDISKKYREAIIHYSKYQNAGIVETEASFKAARIAVEQNHALQAASFLQNVVYINLTLSEQEKIERFETLSDLYTQIGFVRKASFCQRLAATRYVSPQNPSPNWSQCYNLMVQSLPGHKLTLDPVEVTSTDQGWPALQIQLLQELVVAAKRMGHSALATRHMTFLLQTMWKYLTQTEQKEFCVQLQSLAAQCEGAPVALVLDNGAIIPPANLTNIPICQVFTPRSLQPHLQPKNLKAPKEADCGPFLFTPIHFGSLEKSGDDEPKTKMEFLWVENDLCSVTLKLLNPLPFELKVNDMRLLTSGVVFESIPESVIIPPDSATLVTLSGTPKEHGELELQGYSTHTLGVKSNCRLRHFKGFLPFYSVQIVASLPLIEVTTSLPQSASFSSLRDFDSVITSASISLYHGETSECTITLTNKSQITIEHLEVTFQSALDSLVQEKMFIWSNDEVQKQLPLKPGDNVVINLILHAQACFIAPTQSGHDLNSGIFGGSSLMGSVGPSSLPSQFNSPNHSLPGRRTELSSSFRSTNSGQSSSAGWRSPATLMLPPNVLTSVVEGQLQLKYSGGPGLQSEYCRCCSVFFTLEMLPSLQITNWDVLPAETPSNFYLVLDIANLTSQEMELEYAPMKKMLIEGHESCRVPVPVERCPLSKIKNLYVENIEGKSKNNFDLDKIYSDHIAELVNLNWQLLASETKGKASLQGITLAPTMLDVVGMSPIVWEVKINNSSVRPQEEINCNAGDCLELFIKITNSLDEALEDLLLNVQFYQDYENGNYNYRMETRLAMTGISRYPISKLEPRENEEYNCNVIFFTSGVYKLSIKCCTSEKNSVALLTDSSNNLGHVWKFIPPITFKVT